MVGEIWNELKIVKKRVDIVAFMVYYWGMDNKSEVKELKLLVPKKIKDELVQSSKKNFRSMNAEANYILSKALGLEEE